MNKKVLYSVIVVLLLIITVIGSTYAFFVSTANIKNAALSNSTDLNIIYHGGQSFNGNMRVVATKEDGYHTDVTIKLANNSAQAKADIYINIDEITENIRISGFKWEVYKNNNTIPYSQGNFQNYNDTTNNIVTVVDDYELSTTEDTFTIYLWLDGNDSSVGNNVIDGRFSGYISAKSQTITGILGSHTVTFDANGGSVSIPSKQVITGQAYGELPIPTKPGYTFKGWNGKNLFNKDSIDDHNYIASATGEVQNYQGTNALDTWASTEMIKVKPNTVYIKSGTIGGLTQDYFDVSKELISFSSLASGISFTTPNNCYYIKFNLKRTNAPYIDVQLEEGSVATAYEPYYITNNTTVVQDRNHTLKAIWEANS